MHFGRLPDDSIVLYSMNEFDGWLDELDWQRWRRHLFLLPILGHLFLAGSAPEIETGFLNEWIETFWREFRQNREIH